MVTINANYNNLKETYLFSEIARKTKAFADQNPGVPIFRLGVGNTTEPLGTALTNPMHIAVDKLGNVKTYTGYGDEQGNAELRQAIVDSYVKQGIKLEVGEVFVSDGAKADSANIQSIFGQSDVVAVQDPAYPVYVDTAIIAGRRIVYMPCDENNGFSPTVPDQKVDLIYLCSPNNPTGTVLTKSKVKEFVTYALENKAVIIADEAYICFDTDPEHPKSIYEIEGANECAIAIRTHSKSDGLTGVRVGYTILPKNIATEDSPAGRLNALWNRRQTTMFNGASNIAQAAALATFSEEGLRESRQTVNYYLENGQVIKKGLEKKELRFYGGVPYYWVKTPNGMKSWDFFDKVLTEAHVVVTPGIGFGSKGEGFVRISPFGHRENIVKGVDNFVNLLRI